MNITDEKAQSEKSLSTLEIQSNHSQHRQPVRLKQMLEGGDPYEAPNPHRIDPKFIEFVQQYSFNKGRPEEDQINP